jgi:hypothetical protein
MCVWGEGVGPNHPGHMQVIQIKQCVQHKVNSAWGGVTLLIIIIVPRLGRNIRACFVCVLLHKGESSGGVLMLYIFKTNHMPFPKVIDHVSYLSEQQGLQKQVRGVT